MIDFRKYRSANAEVTGVNEFMKDSPLILEIKALLENARKNIAQQLNTELLGLTAGQHYRGIRTEESNPGRIWKTDD